MWAYRHELAEMVNETLQMSALLAPEYGVGVESCERLPDRTLELSAKGFILITAVIPIGGIQLSDK